MDINESNFLQELKTHNTAALEYVIDNYGGLMRSVIRKILYNYPQDAEECLYDSFMKIWKGIDSYDSQKSSFANWSAAIAKYCALDRLRSLKKITLNIELDSDIPVSFAELTKDIEFNRFFYELIDCLNDEDKELFVRLFFIGQTVGEASRATGKKPSIIYNRISRAKRKIRKNNPKLLKGEVLR